MNTLPLNLRAGVMASALGITLLAGLVAAYAAETNAAFSYLAYRFAPRAEGTGRAAPGVASVTALWNPKQSVGLTLPIRGTKATLVNTMGEPRALEVRDGKVEMTVPARKAVYVQEHL